MIHKLRAQYPEYNDLNDGELMAGINQAHYPDMSPEEFQQHCQPHGRPNHDDLAGAAVTGADSLNLQEMDASVKPAVKMTVKELTKHMQRITGKVVIIWNDAAYIIDPTATEPTQAMADILSGNDSEILGYPEDGPADAAVTKQGDVVTDIPTMKRHAETGNVIWAARGQSLPLMEKARRVSAAVLRPR